VSVVLFISDLHLSNGSPQTYYFHEFLARLSPNVSALYILGDLFEVWIGDDDLDDFSLKVISHLREVVACGIDVYCQHGNRDFFIAKRFQALSGCILLPEEYVLTANKRRLLLMHGDTLCENDIAYQRARKWLRNPILQWVFLRLPLSMRRQMALQIRRKSLQYTGAALPVIMDVTQVAVNRVMTKHHVDVLIHGHTHLPNTHTFHLDDTVVERIVLPAWHEHAYALVLGEDGGFSQLPIF